MNELVNKNIEYLIYEIRGKQVMLDSDLANLYGCKNGTKEINQAVKNNINKFPERFSWILTDEELNELRSKILTTNLSNMSRVNPRVFTEQGVYMLATILKGDIATKVTISIMDTFVKLRHYLLNNPDIYISLNNINNKLEKHEKELNLLQETFNKFNNDINEVYFNGKVYDAYSVIKDIFNKAKKELIIIDRFADKTILDIIKDLNIKVILITGYNNKLTKLDIKKYNETYDNLKIVYNDSFHDRYIIIDKIKIYHSGNSINHIGYRNSSINLLEDQSIKNTILDDINKII